LSVDGDHANVNELGVVDVTLNPDGSVGLVVSTAWLLPVTLLPVRVLLTFTLTDASPSRLLALEPRAVTVWEPFASLVVAQEYSNGRASS
jgi:hypothetical protein